MSILNFCLESFGSEHSCHNKEKITLRNMLESIPHQKFFFYHLPTQGRAGIKLGDAWYVSNVSILFYCSMLLYYLFWMLIGSILHYYIIFGTNLLTGGPAQICCFMPISVFRGKGISEGVKTERNQLEKLSLEGKQPRRLGVHVKKETRKARGRGRAHPLGRTLHPRGPLVAPLTYFFLLYMSIYPKNIEEQNRSGFPPP